MDEDIAKEVNQAALDLWRRTFKEDDDVFLPLIYPKIKQSALLFVGLNPSFNASGIEAILRETPYEQLDVENFFHWRNKKNFDLEIAQNIVCYAKDRYPYFRRFIEISKFVKKDWEHIDLYFYPTTNQNNLKHMINTDSPNNNFWKDQLLLSKKLIIGVKPILIVVANAFASGIFKEQFKAIFKEDKGYHEIKLNNQSLPVLLGGMLTGRRALDNYSFERLKWVIRQIIDNDGSR